MLAIIMATEPTAVVSVGRIDELGEAVRLYRSLIGWKSTETLVGLDESSSGTYDWDHGIDDERSRDVSKSCEVVTSSNWSNLSWGRRYGYDFVRL